jgi:SAM-dependent methyltransferase
MAVGVTEFLIGRPLRSVLDVGCGEAPWFPILRRMRPDVRYIGIDSSEYAIQRYGKTRNIRRGTLDDLEKMRLPSAVDLIVCADVLQYVDRRGVERGLQAIRRMVNGVAYIEAFATEDNMAGDHVGWHERSTAEYRELFASAGLTQCAPHCYADLDDMDYLITFEHM